MSDEMFSCIILALKDFIIFSGEYFCVREQRNQTLVLAVTSYERFKENQETIKELQNVLIENHKKMFRGESYHGRQ